MIYIEREREAETQAEGEAGPMPGALRGTRSWDLIPGLEDRALGQRQTLNRWATQGSLCLHFYLYLHFTITDGITLGNRWERKVLKLCWFYLVGGISVIAFQYQRCSSFCPVYVETHTWCYFLHPFVSRPTTLSLSLINQWRTFFWKGWD